MRIEERSIDRAIKKVIGKEENDTNFLGLRDRLTMAFWDSLIPNVGGVEKAHSTMAVVSEALGKLGVGVTIYRNFAEDGASMSSMESQVRIHVNSRNGVLQETSYFPLPLNGVREIYAESSTEIE